MDINIFFFLRSTMEWIALLIACLISLCGDRDFRTRERATAMLAKLSDVGIEKLKVAEKCADPEVAARCKPLVDAWYRKNAHLVVDQLLAPGWKSFPWAWALWDEYYEFDAEVTRYGNLAGANFHFTNPDNVDWKIRSDATRLWMIDRLKARLPCDSILQQLADAQRRFLRENKYDRSEIPPRWRMPK